MYEGTITMAVAQYVLNSAKNQLNVRIKNRITIDPFELAYTHINIKFCFIGIHRLYMIRSAVIHR